MYMSFATIFAVIFIAAFYFTKKNNLHNKMLNYPEYKKAYLVKLITEVYMLQLSTISNFNKDGKSNLMGTVSGAEEIYNSLLKKPISVLIDEEGDEIDISDDDKVKRNISDKFDN